MLRSSLQSILLVLLFVGVGSCKKDSSPRQLPNEIKNGNWIVSSYIDNGVNETNHFTGYAFTFTDPSTVTAQNGTSTVTGTWTAGKDDSHEKLVLLFTTPPFTELNEDWRALEISSTRLMFSHVSGGSGVADSLTFQRQ